MTFYRVVWEIEIEAKTPESAALEALKIQRDSKSLATAFSVFNKRSFKFVDCGVWIDTPSPE